MKGKKEYDSLASIDFFFFLTGLLFKADDSLVKENAIVFDTKFLLGIFG